MEPSRRFLSLSTKTEVSREEAYSINLVDEFHGGCGMKEQED
jgi:hypothetical protein